MSINKNMRYIFFLIAGFLVLQAQAQENGLTLQDTIIFSDASFTSYYSITAGPNLLIAATGNLTLNTRERVYFKPGLTVVGGGKLQTINDQGIVNSIEESEVLLVPEVFSVKQNYPNPFNPTTVIAYTLPASEDVTIAVYNSLGQLTRNLFSARQGAGKHSVVWDARNNAGTPVSAGTYYYKLKAGKSTAIKKMVLLK